MGGSEKIKDRAGVAEESSEMYSPDDGEAVDPELVEDPHTLEDESTPGIVDRVLRYRWVALGWGILLAALFAYLTWIGHTYVFSILTHPLFIGAAVTVAYTAIVWVLGWRNCKKKLRHLDEYVQHQPRTGDPMRRFLGRYKSSQMGNAVFVPYKGTKWFGLRWEPYRREDFAFDSNPKEPVKILVRREALVRRTDTGIVVSHISPDLEKSTDDDEIAELIPERPDLADKGTVQEMGKEIKNLEEQLDEKEKLLQTAREKAKKAIEEAKKSRDEHVDDYIDRYNSQRESEPSRVTAHSGLESGLNNIEDALDDE